VQNCTLNLNRIRNSPNNTSSSALFSMAKFFLVLIVVAFVTLIGAFVFAAFTL